jgi:hypothetical protein
MLGVGEVENGKLGLGAPAKFQIVDMGLGRVALRASAGYLSVAAGGGVSVEPAPSQKARSFQWRETPTGELVLMSLVTNRFLGIGVESRILRADRSGPQ